MHETSPRRRKKELRTEALLNQRHLPCNLIWRKQVIGIQPLNIVTPALQERIVPCCRSPLIGLCNNANSLGFKLSRNGSSLIFRAIVYDYNFRPGPCLRSSRTDSACNPSFCVVGGNKNRYQR